jgi:hypothetical protein
MDTSTRLPGNGLLSEGLPFEWHQGDEEDAPSWHRTGRWVHVGHAVCSCGEASPEPLETNGQRKRWHREVHKPEVRARIGGSDG